MGTGFQCSVSAIGIASYTWCAMNVQVAQRHDDEPRYLPDLPELEFAVCYTNSRLLLLILVLVLPAIPTLLLLGVASLFGPLNHTHLERLSGPLLAVLCPTIFLVFLVCWIHKKTGLLGLSWYTSTDGLEMDSWLTTRFIHWSSVLDARDRRLRWGPHYELTTTQGIVNVPVSDVRFAASVWLHLRRLGKAANLELPREALGFWRAVPPGVRTEMSWRNPNPPERRTIRRGGLLSILLAVTALVLIGLERKWLAAIAGYAGFLLAFTVWEQLAEPLFLRIDATHIYFRGVLFRRRWAWADVVSAHCDSGGTYIRAAVWRGVYVPWRADDPASAQLVLAVIRRLRQDDMGFALPVDLDLIAASGL